MKDLPVRCQYKREQYSRCECMEIQGIPQNITIKNLEVTVTSKIFEKIGISLNKHMIVASHKQRKQLSNLLTERMQNSF